ncbi:DUF3365 domain-containing protein [Balneolaceae bacterium YR4-1]|uniref:DUF3365 domain-containing protein n=1 Tax=Halalkalibaculum roseum TaxID=2709311 RepID=A0A6M1SZE8_9BACT|nr:DUF3365 domain-containing protein [Halalkalibaculum roseum]NGP76554.1 DUF3365 domain-containing protein [Halalkalibaculum roseum]
MRNCFILFFLLLFGCGHPNGETGTETLARKDLPAVKQKGSEITGQAFNTLSSNLKQAMSEGGVAYALEFCNVKAIPLTDSLSQYTGIEIRRSSHRPRNPRNRADSLEMKSIREFMARIEQNEEPEPITYRSKNTYIYHAPIKINNGLCLNCHGQPGTDISEQNLALINKLYTEDQATGFSIGDLRGIWSIEIPKTVIDSLQAAAN